MTDYHEYTRPGYTGANPYPASDPLQVQRGGSVTGIVVTLGIVVVFTIALFALASFSTSTGNASNGGVQSAPTATVPAPAEQQMEQTGQPAVPTMPQVAPGEQVQ